MISSMIAIGIVLSFARETGKAGRRQNVPRTTGRGSSSRSTIGADA
jgi:hypothetical protein